MAVKYECPKCGRRFAEWGAEKLGFHCPVDEWCPKDATEEILFVRAGSAEAGGRSPSLKRKRKAAVVAPVEHVEEEVVAPVEEIEEPEEDIEEEVEVEEEEELVIAKVAPPSDEHAEVAVDEDSVDEADVEDLEFEGDELAASDDAEVETTEEDWA